MARIPVMVFALAAAWGLAACDDGNVLPVQLYFGMENSAPCRTLDITIDLAGATIDRSGGELDCVLDAVLAADGCDAEFVESDGGARLTVSLDGCEVTRATLFHCGLRYADIAALNAGIHASCDCANEPVCELNGSTCYREPGICVTESASGFGCEDCYNHVDDDGDGDVDCDDGECFYSCGVGLTTITCSSSTTYTTMPTSTTLD